MEEHAHGRQRSKSDMIINTPALKMRVAIFLNPKPLFVNYLMAGPVYLQRKGLRTADKSAGGRVCVEVQ